MAANIYVSVSDAQLNKIGRVVQKTAEDIRTDSLVYQQILDLLRAGIEPNLPVDSGALQAGSGVHFPTKMYKAKNGRMYQQTQYPRYGNTYTTERALAFNPWEERPNRNVNYGYFPRIHSAILEAKNDFISSPEFVEGVTDIIVSSMERNKG